MDYPGDFMIDRIGCARQHPFAEKRSVHEAQLSLQSQRAHVSRGEGTDVSSVPHLLAAVIVQYKLKPHSLILWGFVVEGRDMLPFSV